MLFIENKYTKCYFSIIAAAQTRSLVTDYTENHHIIPKSLGGENNKTNMVRLLAREHFICHMLLIKMVSDPALRHKMQFAINSFRRASKNQQRHIMTSVQYEMVRKQVSMARSSANIGNQYGAGFKHTPEMIEKRVKQVRGKKRKPHTEETKKAISLATTGLKKSEETKQRMRKPKSQAHRDHLREANIGKTLAASTILKLKSPKKRVTCPHCNKTGGKGNMTRYHFNNCKFK